MVLLIDEEKLFDRNKHLSIIKTVKNLEILNNVPLILRAF